MKQKISWLVLGVTLAALSGCASVSGFDSDQTSIASDAYVVALSVNTSEQSGVEPAEGSDYFGAVALGIENGPYVQLSGMNLGLNIMMFEVPRSRFDIGELVLAWPSAEGQYNYYRTASDGPKINLEPGQITYVGSLLITATDMQDGVPSAVGLEFRDAWQQDADAWAEYYPVVTRHVPVIHVADSWGGPGLVALESTSRRSTTNMYRPRFENASSHQSRIQSSGGQP